MIIKSYIVEQNFSVLEKYQATLLYGENDGLKDDIKSKVKNLNNNAEIINFFESEILKNKNILYENIVNDSLFSEKKIIFIQLATDKILHEISECLEKNNKNIKIYIFADNLDKKSKLRTLFEKEKNLAILACYEDNERTLINYINKELNGYKGVSGELINIIMANSSLNRQVIQSELVKIKNFFIKKNINKEQLLELLNIKNNTGFDEIRDSTLSGKKNKVNKLLSQIDLLHEDSFFYLNNLNYRILKLIEIQKFNVKYKNYEKTLDNFKPTIFWKDKSIFLEQLGKWDIIKLNKAAYKIGETELLMKKSSQIKNDIIIKNLIVFLSIEASTSF